MLEEMEFKFKTKKVKISLKELFKKYKGNNLI